MQAQTTQVKGLKELGLEPSEIFHNLSYDEIYEHEKRNGETVVSSNGTMMVDTGIFTGRSPKDKYFVDEPSSNGNIWWSHINFKVSEAIFDELYKKCVNYLSHKKLYVFDGYAGANPETRVSLRVVSEKAWQHHFCTNMFLRPTKEELSGLNPEFTIINACGIKNENFKQHGMNSEVFVIFHLAKKICIIGGTEYGGEMKKGIFSVMNYKLPLEGILSMHCSANVGQQGDTALFFGLSGTGKTTLSTDPNRKLIGDDEHGWDDNGIFNIEGGCYAKVINLDPKTEPDIYEAIRRDALLENVVYDPQTKVVDYSSAAKTENTRVSYPIFHINNIQVPSKGGHPKTIIFLTYDAFGVLPPVSKLSIEQAMYHFLSGYTAKVAGTERGIKEPTATFSACFGAAFMTLHPTKYAKLLGEKMRKHNVRAYLMNTGLVGGSYGVGKRMNLPSTRKIIDEILNGNIEKSEFVTHPIFQVAYPKAISGVDSAILDPREAWADKSAYDATAKKLGEMFIKNFKQYAEGSKDFDFTAFGPKV
ncbi:MULTISPECIES: phosphoenolpyruvate carboxykinase (ATP) [Leptospira]|uniref:Phosphoenolpyruvate carboxykinase (ATP) n=1 Tax=Leptospira santarosai serovar Arenal str. MAVJ 401 TaxID=1049976 RepID=M6K7J5_9LEPT|nr:MULTISPECIES: phosphoenolpyruvate carboxykinase (ATP) [Leptospira]EKO76922.1 phosphoenolpyruvate carboxykinase (ATP) [Leptospira sp. Fiocruz LV3954]EMI67152.1 phosphoenolpyruvate carboxykinase (ATP) [Leptospira sp. Fiocruz LV4135]EMN23712.1 phosphoenolpyruvate carboxykinase (ATP) [Leptospira santarosai serovar Arenal str. MAVJ 401]EMO22730.1 phosphoenolpyruvate carboxykinase (ATP) [Leptospira santarosai str. HAI134]EMP79885.1 phosphoenolpyruvate carboxykinase (ATP) [Leptospira santarosai st